MSTTKHTPGRWKVGATGFSVYTEQLGKEAIATCHDYGRENAGEAQANAARIVACVNNCEGINPEAVPEMLQALKQVAMYSRICHMVPKDYGDLVAAAIAKAEGRE